MTGFRFGLEVPAELGSVTFCKWERPLVFAQITGALANWRLVIKVDG